MCVLHSTWIVAAPNNVWKAERSIIFTRSRVSRGLDATCNIYWRHAPLTSIDDACIICAHVATPSGVYAQIEIFSAHSACPCIVYGHSTDQWQKHSIGDSGVLTLIMAGPTGTGSLRSIFGSRSLKIVFDDVENPNADLIDNRNEIMIKIVQVHAQLFQWTIWSTVSIAQTGTTYVEHSPGDFHCVYRQRRSGP